MGAEFPINTPFKSNVPRLAEFLESLSINGTTWKIKREHSHHTLRLNPEEYLSLRGTLHHHDPRISLAAASHHLYTTGGREIPFSWQDWVDLAPLNPYLPGVEGDSPTCAQFLDQGLDYPNGHTINVNHNEYYCLDNTQFLKTDRGALHKEELLPGFNFQAWMPTKKSFPEKFIFAKSLLLSGLDIPDNMFFLTNDGGYIKVKPVVAKPMAQSGVLQNYFDSLDSAHDTQDVGIDPLFQFETFANSSGRAASLRPEMGLELDFEDFVLDSNFKGKSDKFIESIEFSKLMNPYIAPKYFHEVNIKFPASYKGHKLTEDGGHYDYRFFSGFSTEIPESIHKPHSPNFPPDQYKYPEDANSTPQFNYDSADKRKKIILSNLIHTLLTFAHGSNHPIILAHGSLLAWYFNGVSFPWDNDSDVQMPINQLLSFCDNFNQSMVVQNPRYGFGKYFLDCSSFLTHRTKSNENNNIDARFIDIDSGFFVDITGLSISSEMMKRSDWSKLAPVLPRGAYNGYPTLKPVVVSPSRQKAKQGHLKEIDADADAVFANGQRPELTDELDDSIPKFQESPLNEDITDKLLEFNTKHGIVNCRNRHFYTITN